MPPMPTVVVAQVRGGVRGFYRLSGGTSLSGSLGSWGAGDPFGLPTNNQGWQVPWDDVVEFGGDFYVSHVSNSNTCLVYRRTPAGTVTQVYSVPNAGLGGTPFNELHKTGMYVVNSGTTRYLCFLIRENAVSQWYLVRSTDGTTWTRIALGTGGSTNPYRPGIAVYRGQILVCVNNQLIIVNVAAGTMSVVTTGFSDSGCSILPFKGRIFAHATFGGGFARLWELNGGAFVSRANVSVNNSPAGNQTAGQNMPCLFPVKDAGATDGMKMVLIFLDYTASNANWHWRAVDIDVDGDTFTVTARDTLIPTALRNGGAQANKHFVGWGCFIDNESDPANPRTYLFSWPSINSAITHYEYVNSGSELIGQTVGLNSSNFSLCGTRWGGGERINSSDVSGAELGISNLTFSQGNTPGTINVSVRAYGDAGNANKYLRGYFSAGEGPVMVQMTLTGSVTGGGTRNGNQIEGVDADGATTYTFVWAASTDGLVNGQPFNAEIIVSTE